MDWSNLATVSEDWELATLIYHPYEVAVLCNDVKKINTAMACTNQRFEKNTLSDIGFVVGLS